MFSLIIPVYKNQGSIPDLVDAVDKMNQQLNDQLEVVFVVDGSPDQSAQILQTMLQERSFNSRLILLSRNFGSFSAIRVGLQNATGKYFAVMAADLQEPPELILNFFQILSGNDTDVVIGTREARADPLYTRLSANLFWATYRKLIVPQMPLGGVDIFGCNLAFRDCLLACEETNTSLIALIFWLGFRRKQVAYKRLERVHGQSAWTLKKKVNYLMDSVFAFTDLPIKFLLALGAVGVFVSALFGSVILIARLTGLLNVPGYATTILLILFFGGINTFGLGLVGSYAWRGYENTKRRPQAIVLREMIFKNKHELTELKE
ncbi:glycosyltransferase involved in cell wall biosynthesis [Oxalobacteraceae bacterium GrIS 2.11]